MLSLIEFVVANLVALIGNGMESFGNFVFFSAGGSLAAIFGIGIFLLVLIGIAAFFSNIGRIIVWTPLIILGFLLLKSIVVGVLILWAFYMIVQARRGNIY